MSVHSISVTLLAILSTVILHLPCKECFMNLFLNRDETFRLLGLGANLYYIQDGNVNTYALGFQVPVPPNISMLHFTWQRLVETPVPYSISMSLDDVNALKSPAINISRKGIVPLKEEVFRIVLPCASRVNAEVDVNIYFNLTLLGSGSTPNVTSLILKRKKLCLMNTEDVIPTTLPPPKTIQEQEDEPVPPNTLASVVTSLQEPHSLLFMAIGFILVFLFLVSSYFRSNYTRKQLETIVTSTPTVVSDAEPYYSTIPGTSSEAAASQRKLLVIYL